MFEQTFKNIDDILHKDAGCTSELDYTEQSSWLLFLKYLDALEADKATEAALEGKAYPRQYLKMKGLTSGAYNQIANYVIAQSEINIAIGAKAPLAYFDELRQQTSGGAARYGGITDHQEMLANLETNCIPDGVLQGEVPDYLGFLELRRHLMAQKIRTWFLGL